MSKDEVLWMYRFFENTDRRFDVDAHANEIAFAHQRGDDPWEAASAMCEGTWDPNSKRLEGAWDKEMGR